MYEIMNAMIKHWQKIRSGGIEIDHKKLETVLFALADDQVVLAETEDKLQRKVPSNSDNRKIRPEEFYNEDENEGISRIRLGMK